MIDGVEVYEMRCFENGFKLNDVFFSFWQLLEFYHPPRFFKPHRLNTVLGVSPLVGVQNTLFVKTALIIERRGILVPGKPLMPFFSKFSINLASNHHAFFSNGHQCHDFPPLQTFYLRIKQYILVYMKNDRH